MHKDDIATKKVILFIVEGITDKTSLGLILSKIIASSSVFFAIVNGDICYKEGISSANIISAVNDVLLHFMKANKFKPNDFLRMVHIIDTDGAFIPANRIVETTQNRIVYHNDHIEASNVTATIVRLKNKAEVLNKLLSTKKINSIPYNIYYFSRNLEHVLHNIGSEVSSDEKLRLSEKFEDSFANCPHGFIPFIESNEFAVTGTYQQTWHFIQLNVNSLNRYSNFHILFDEINCNQIIPPPPPSSSSP